MSKGSVSYLQQITFTQLSLSEKGDVKNYGRPVPDLQIFQTSCSRKSAYQRKFNRDIYSKHDWLCGCEVKIALFCFPCLLYGGDATWTKTGVWDLSHMPEKIKKHESSAKHLRNVIDLAMLGKVNIATQVSEAYRSSINKHNEEVRRNRDILSKIIDCIKFCGKFKLPLHGHDKSSDSANPVVFRGLLEFAGKLDENLKTHFETATVFKGNSKAIQNELLDCILEVCRAETAAEISRSKFLAVMSDNTTDVSEKSQEVVVFRYENEGTVHERFWGFYNPSSQDAEGLSEYVLEQLGIVLKGDVGKLIAQTYDGAAIMSGEKGGVQTKIKETYINAHFIHCYAHQLNLIMEKAASQNPEVHIFFSSLSGIPTFFSRSPQRLSVLGSVSKRISQGSSTRWNLNSSFVNVVYEGINEFKECFKELQKSKNIPTVQGASGLLRLLNDKHFLFWLSFFHRIMPHVDLLYDELQSYNANSSTVHSALGDFYNAVSNIRNEISLTSESSEEPPEFKKQKLNEDLTILAKEVCDTICFQAKERFKYTGHLSAEKLLVCEQFPLYNQEFPSKEFDETVLAYPMLNKERLRTELSVLYERKEFYEVSGALKLHQIIICSELQNSLAEVHRLLKIILTTPMTTEEPERCFSTMNRIKTFLRSTMSEDHLSALAMLSVEKNLIESSNNFNEKVIEAFVLRKERIMDFTYK